MPSKKTKKPAALKAPACPATSRQDHLRVDIEALPKEEASALTNFLFWSLVMHSGVFVVQPRITQSIARYVELRTEQHDTSPVAEFICSLVDGYFKGPLTPKMIYGMIGALEGEHSAAVDRAKHFNEFYPAAGGAQ